MTLASFPDPRSADIDLQALRVVRAIAELGSITAAADHLGYSQPAVSQQLRKLENKLGLPVVERVGRGIRLTVAGEILAKHSLTVNTALDAAAGEIAEVWGRRSGRVRVAAFPTASSTIVTSLLSELATRHPAITVQFFEAEPPESIDMLRSGAVDLAITFSYPGNDADPHHDRSRGLHVSELWRDEMLVAIPSGHPIAKQDAVDLRDLADERWIAGCLLCRGHLLSVCGSSGFSPQITYETDNFVAVTNMVGAGLAVALVPNLFLAASALPPGAVVRPTSPASFRTINLVYAHGAEKVPVNAVTIRLIQAFEHARWSLGQA